ncbi:nitrate reductase subunit alpha [Aneurinibacillus terranovensis]|uniref:nitrate reductase subunit alpha n=1 Tax=Aneurinibacillus terranovensis TaxID=278991 RepID=UPI000411129C|nr:nitrate reductase subunit alpha [Aneurinibacillus terranovensis]
MPKKPIKLIQSLKYLRRGERFNNDWSEESPRSREWEKLYRQRWQHDRVVRSTHGVNCTGSCSWKIHVKDGIITWETQQTDYPTIGKDFPEYEPRGCPRGATFSWYTYSPQRVKYPYVRGDLVKLWRSEYEKTKDPVLAWKNIVSDPEKRNAYQESRGKGGFVRSSWEEVTELIAAATIHTIKQYGPDRVTGFSPIPAMSMASYAAGTRFLSLIGGTILSFYDWYADLPPASPQIWGEQTDVPESADWYNSKYFIIWGTNLPMTRTPDAHFMVEARYNGTKVIGISPDYAEYDKFADIWLPAKAGTDGALAMAMTHIILKEFYVDRQTEYFTSYVKKYTDLPFLVILKPHEDGYMADRFLHASDLTKEHDLGEWKTVFWDKNKNKPTVPNGSQGFRWDQSKKWNLKLENEDGTSLNPLLSFLDDSDENAMVSFPYFGDEKGEFIHRAVPAKKIKGIHGEKFLVTTVFDLMMAHAGVDRGLPGDYPKSYDDMLPYTPAWQEAITGVDRSLAIQVAREFADNAARTKGKSMIAMGAGTNHWYHSDQLYRCILNLVLLTGCQGVNGGGWAHYVGQEKVRPLEGWTQVAFASDWVKPARLQNGTSFFYFATNQFRYEELDTTTVGSQVGGRFQKMHPADMNALAARLGWLPSYPQFTQNSIGIVEEARKNGAGTDEGVIQYVVDEIEKENINWAIEDPDNPKNYPRILFNWRSNLLGASAKGHEYFLKHLLGADNQVLSEETKSWQPETVRFTEDIPKGKLDLFVNIDFRMTSSCLYSDIVLPASTWYEKYDISSTDMHPYIHPFNAAITSPWEARSDWDAFRYLAEVFSTLAKKHLPACDDLMVVPLGHDTIDEIAQPNGKVLDWRNKEVKPIPGKTMPKMVILHRDYPNVYEQMITIGPNIEKNITTKGITISGEKAYSDLKKRLGVSKREGVGKGRPDLYHDKQAIDAILTLSGATNGDRAVEGWKSLSNVTGLDLTGIALGREEEAFTLFDLTAQPKSAISTPVWSGLEKDGRRYSPFTVNTEYQVPWRTLTGRQHFYLDHEVMLDFGEGLPIYRPPLRFGPYLPDEKELDNNEKYIVVRYLTPHQKWGIHTTYTEIPNMMTLFRGGQTIWINEKDAASIGVKDNQWVEVYNRNGVIAARAVLTYRIPEGMAMMYHAQDRTINVPGTSNKKRGGTHNSVTRIIPKPTHMIGGYSQLSYNFNYYGPTGHQRDIITIIRPLKEVDWLED